MAKKEGVKPETKSEFLRKVLSKNPDLDYPQVNRRWAKAGHAGEISNALYYKVRAELGIKTEWVWVKEGGPETRGSQEPQPERAARPNDDLVHFRQSAPVAPHSAPVARSAGFGCDGRLPRTTT